MDEGLMKCIVHPKVALLLIATGKYDRYLPGVVASAREHFLAGELTIVLFSDRAPQVDMQGPCDYIPTKHRPWPYPSLYRYHFFSKARERLVAYDFLYYIDVDSRFIAPVDREILGDLVAVPHLSYPITAPPPTLPYERCPLSSAYVAVDKGRRYYSGGFQGGRTDVYLKACDVMRMTIDLDERKGIMATWHDESHWNCYLVDHAPTVTLQGFAADERNPTPEAKLLWLQKDHAAIRSA